MAKKQVCTECGKQSIPGMLRGHGKCQYHWDVCAFGKAWADEVESRKLKKEAGR